MSGEAGLEIAKRCQDSGLRWLSCTFEDAHLKQVEVSISNISAEARAALLQGGLSVVQQQ